MIAPKIPLVQDGQILSTNLVNSMIGRIEYAADLLRQYKLVAGDEMYVEPHFDGTRVSYFQPVKGGATPAQPVFGVVPPLFNPDGTQNARANTIWVMNYMMREDVSPALFQKIVDMFTEGVELDPAVFNERYPGTVMVMNMKSNGLMQGPSGNPPGFVVGAPRPIPPFNPYGRGVIGQKTFCQLIVPPTPGEPPSAVGIWVSAE